MSSGAYIATIISVSAFMLGAVITVVLFIGGSLGQRMTKLEHRIDTVETGLGARIDILNGHVQDLRADVAVLKATQ